MTHDDTPVDNTDTAATRLAHEIRRLRKAANFSQPQLAAAIGYTPQYVSLAERPGKGLPSATLVAAIDRALNANGTLLTLRNHADTEQQAVRLDVTDDHASDASVRTAALQDQLPILDDLRRAILGRHVYQGDPDGTTFSVERLEADASQVHRQYQMADYDGAARLLPSVVDRLATPGAENSIPARAKAVAYLAAAKLATKLGDSGLTWVSADRSLRFGAETEQCGLVGVASYQVTCAMMASGHLSDAEQTAVMAAEQMARDASSAEITEDALSARGSLLLLLAIIAARRGDARAAQNRLGDATLLADKLGQDGNCLWTAFGPTNVAFHELAVHVSLGNSRKALQLGETIDTDVLPTVLRGRRSQVHLELGWASVNEGDDSVAVLHLLEAERVAKQVVSRNTTARALLATLLARERKGATPGLRALAARAEVLR